MSGSNSNSAKKPAGWRLDNGFLWRAEPEHLQQLPDPLSPADVQTFFDRWIDCVPWPLITAERIARYRQRFNSKCGLTQVFTRPCTDVSSWRVIIGDNLDLGRPDRVSLLSPIRLTDASLHRIWATTPIIMYGVAPRLHVEFKHLHLKQNFQEQPALATETTIHDPLDFQRIKRLDTCEPACYRAADQQQVAASRTPG